MQGRQSHPGTGGSTRADNGRLGVPHHPLDRSHLLRRSRRFPFPVAGQNGLVRIRRERRVFGSFMGIPSLSRGQDD
jgi:hypothetical protein